MSTPEPDKTLAERLALASNALDLAQAQVGGRGWAHERQVLVDELLNSHRSGQLITLAEAQAMAMVAAAEHPVTMTHMLGMHAAELSVDFCRLGLFPSVGVDDSGEFVLGPFSLNDGKIIHGCASVFWDAEAKKYCWSAYIDFGVIEIRGQWPVDIMPDEIAAAIRAAATGTKEGD